MSLFPLRPVLWVFVSALGLAQTAPKLTVDQVVEEALNRNLKLLADKYDIGVADARILQARARPNPVLYVQGQYMDILGAGFGLTNPAGPPEFDIGANVTVEQRGKRTARIELAQSVKAVTEMEFLSKTRALIFEVQNAFVEAQLAEENAAILRESSQALETIVKLNQARVQAGDLAGVELARTEVAALQFENQVLQAEARFRAAKFRLQTLMGRTVMDPQFDIVEEFRREDLTKLLPEIQARALENRPELLAARRDLERARADIAYQQKQTIGDTTFQLNFNRQWDIGIQRGRAITLGLLQPIPVWNRNKGEIERASQERLQAQMRVRAIEAEIAGEAQNAFVRFTTAKQLLTNIETRMLDRAQRVRQTIDYSYRRGEASFIELLDAQRALSETRLSHNEARAEYSKSLYLIESITGASVKRP
ncbi:MAG: TolC family protein [Acidobacteria bacterium]|nr:TolC family protein [Acidobacteriota bacterium]